MIPRSVTQPKQTERPEKLMFSRSSHILGSFLSLSHVTSINTWEGRYDGPHFECVNGVSEMSSTLPRSVQLMRLGVPSRAVRRRLEGRGVSGHWVALSFLLPSSLSLCPFPLLPRYFRSCLPDSFFFSIVRDPAALARSAFSYYKSTSSAFHKAPSLAAFLANPRAFYRPGAGGPLCT